MNRRDEPTRRLVDRWTFSSSMGSARQDALEKLTRVTSMKQSFAFCVLSNLAFDSIFSISFMLKMAAAIFCLKCMTSYSVAFGLSSPMMVESGLDWIKFRKLVSAYKGDWANNRGLVSRVRVDTTKTWGKKEDFWNLPIRSCFWNPTCFFVETHLNSRSGTQVRPPSSGWPLRRHSPPRQSGIGFACTWLVLKITTCLRNFELIELDAATALIQTLQ